MSSLLCFGLGYCAQHYVAQCGDAFEGIVGTVRGAERARALNALQPDRLQIVLFDGGAPAPALREAIGLADRLLISAPPGERGDPVLAVAEQALAASSRLPAIVYLSTVGVYGDHGGAWVDEATPPQPDSARSRRRLEAERAWQNLGSRCGAAVAVLRLAGIYGPGRNALLQVANGTARRIVKAGQIFNRIHVHDIARAIDAAFAGAAAGVFNLADDEPSPPGDPLVFAAQLLGREPPPEIRFEDAAPSMSPMALSFWQDCRRVRNDKLKCLLGRDLTYPTYREGLRALLSTINGDEGVAPPR